MTKHLILLILLLPFAVHAQEPDVFEDFEQNNGTWSALKSTADISSTHFKSGSRSLEWKWKKPEAQLSITFPRQTISSTKTATSHFGVWIYTPAPLKTRLYADLYDGKEKTGTVWFNLDYAGWRVLGVNYIKLGMPGGSGIDQIIFHAPGDQGAIYIDALKPSFLSRPVRPDDQQPWADDPSILGLPPSETVYSYKDISLNRPWLPQLLPASRITRKTKSDIKRLEEHYGRNIHHGGALQYRSFEELKKAFQQTGIRDADGIVTGPPLECADKNSMFHPLPGALDLDNGLMPLLRRISTAARQEQGENREEALRMFTTLIRFFLDQGFQEGNNNYGSFDGGYANFRYFPGAVFALRNELKDEALRDSIARSLAHLSMGWSMLNRNVFTSTDYFYNYSPHLPAAILMIPDEGMKYQRLKAYQRYMDGIILNPLPFGADGTIHHHWGHHLGYGGYSPPVFLRTQVLPFKNTEFFISEKAHEKIRLLVKAVAFQAVNGRVAPNIYMRAGTDYPLDAASLSLAAARLGGLDGKTEIDREIAGIYLNEIKGKSSPDADEFLKAGIRSIEPEGHMTLNLAAISIQRRKGWQAAAAGMLKAFRGLEIYGWIESNNYARYARNGSIFLTVNGEHGWRKDGWNSNFWPGATTPVRPSHELFEGYNMFGNDNNMAGGTSMEQDGIWGMKLGSPDTRFKKSAFFFGNRIIVMTSDIEGGIPDAEYVTALFQQAVLPSSLAVEANGGPTTKYISTGEQAACLRDNMGNGYYIFPGTPFSYKRSMQEWTYFFKANLKNPADNPCIDIRKKHFREQPLAENAKYYAPTSGEFDLAFFSHGTAPAKGGCAYVILMQANPAALKKFAAQMQEEHPPVEILQKDGNAHVVYDAITRTWGYVIFDAAHELPGPLKKSNLPGFIIIREQKENYNISVGTSDPENNTRYRLDFKNGKVAGVWPNYPLGNTAHIAQ